MAENLETKYVGEEIHPGETVEEKISLSERFGLWVTFYPFDQDEYLEIVRQWLKNFGVSAFQEEEALQWALQRGSRSGRVAYQFARDWAGRHSKKMGLRSSRLSWNASTAAFSSRSARPARSTPDGGSFPAAR
jgi:predicted AAA+ superfamily ATPase